MSSRQPSTAEEPIRDIVAREPGLVPAPSEDGDDPVLGSLDRARAYYREARASWLHQLADLRQQSADVKRMREMQRQLNAQIEQLQAELERERRRTAQHKDRAARLAEALKGIHRAFYEGNVFALILRACLTITGATRGLYITVWGDGKLRIRAAVDVDGYPAKPPSEFLQEICRKAADEKRCFVANQPADWQQIQATPPVGEEFRNCLAAPVVLLKNFNGIVLLADKLHGDFDEDDVDMVISIGDQAGVAVENQQLQAELLKAYFSIVGVLADAVEAKDPYTHGHCEMVARYSRLVAERMGLTDGDRSVVCYGGLLHDVGKIGVSDGILNKPGKLMPEEWELMRSHVRLGRDILARVSVLDRVADVVLHHHERFDGAGYPEGLKGEQISLAARIVCVADAYCAMIAKRSYKESLTDAEARAELIRCKGSHFDPAVVDAFLAILDLPEALEDCPDACGLPPQFFPLEEFRHALHPPFKSS